MRKSRFSEEQIIKVINEREAGVKLGDLEQDLAVETAEIRRNGNLRTSGDGEV